MEKISEKISRFERLRFYVISLKKEDINDNVKEKLFDIKEQAKDVIKNIPRTDGNTHILTGHAYDIIFKIDELLN